MSGDTWHDPVDATWHHKGVTHGMIAMWCSKLGLMAHIEPSVKCRIKKERKIKKNEENHMCQGGKVGRKFPHLTNSFDEDQIEKPKEKNKEKRKKINNREKKKEVKNETNRREKEKQRKKGFPLLSKIYENRALGFHQS